MPDEPTEAAIREAILRSRTMTERRLFRAGDVVFHRPSGKSCCLGADECGGRVYWYEYDAAVLTKSIAMANDCTLVRAASDTERIQALCRTVADEWFDFSSTTNHAWQQLQEEKKRMEEVVDRVDADVAVSRIQKFERTGPTTLASEEAERSEEQTDAL